MVLFDVMETTCTIYSLECYILRYSNDAGNVY